MNGVLVPRFVKFIILSGYAVVFLDSSEQENDDEELLGILNQDYLTTVERGRAYLKRLDGDSSDEEEDTEVVDENRVEGDVEEQEEDVTHYQPLEDDDFGEYAYVPPVYTDEEDDETMFETPTVIAPSEPPRLSIAPLSQSTDQYSIFMKQQL
jgi:hypothetical protein